MIGYRTSLVLLSLCLPPAAGMAVAQSLPGEPPRGCVAPDDALRVDRLPGAPATTARTRNPLANERLHCSQIEGARPGARTKPRHVRGRTEPGSR
jgi:hypothetical protein